MKASWSFSCYRMIGIVLIYLWDNDHMERFTSHLFSVIYKFRTILLQINDFCDGPELVESILEETVKDGEGWINLDELKSLVGE